MAGDAESLVYFKLTQNGSSLDGYMQTVNAALSNRQGVVTQTINLSGSAHGNTVSVRADGFFGVRSGLFSGKKRGDVLELEYPAQDGRVAKLILKQASADQWNRTVSTFETKMSRYVYLNQLAEDYKSTSYQFSEWKSKLSSDQIALQQVSNADNGLQQHLAESLSEYSQAKLTHDEAELAYKKQAAISTDGLTGDAYQAYLAEYQKSLQVEGDTGRLLSSAEQALYEAKNNAERNRDDINRYNASVKNDLDSIHTLNNRATADVDQIHRVMALLHIKVPAVKNNKK